MISKVGGYLAIAADRILDRVLLQCVIRSRQGLVTFNGWGGFRTIARFARISDLLRLLPIENTGGLVVVHRRGTRFTLEWKPPLEGVERAADLR